MPPDHENPTEVTGAAHLPVRVPVNLERLDQERALRGWTKGQLAEAMGVVPETIRELYRSGEATAQTFGKLTVALDANPPSDTARGLARTA